MLFAQNSALNANCVRRSIDVKVEGTTPHARGPRCTGYTAAGSRTALDQAVRAEPYT